MKHMKAMTKQVPAKAILGEDHPGLKDSVMGLIQDPLGTVRLHLQKPE